MFSRGYVASAALEFRVLAAMASAKQGCKGRYELFLQAVTIQAADGQGTC